MVVSGANVIKTEEIDKDRGHAAVNEGGEENKHKSALVLNAISKGEHRFEDSSLLESRRHGSPRLQSAFSTLRIL